MRCALFLVALAPIIALAGLEIGDPMPMQDVKMAATSGGEIAYADVKGAKATVVVFWCNHCPYVKAWRDRFAAVARDYQDRGVGFLAVNSNDPRTVPGDDLESMRATATEHQYPYAYVVDKGSALAQAMGGERTPHVFVFDAANKLVYVGAIDDSADAAKVEKQYLREVLDAVVAGQPPPRAKTKAFGCSIKWYK